MQRGDSCCKKNGVDVMFGLFNKKVDENLIATHFLKGLVNCFSQDGCMRSVTLYPSGGEMEVEASAYNIGGHIARLLLGEREVSDLKYVGNGELLKWFKDNTPEMVPTFPEDEKVEIQPDVDGECNARWATNRCNGPEGHDSDHGLFMGGGLILGPWPRKKGELAAKATSPTP